MKNDLTFGLLDAICKKQAGINNDNEITIEARQRYINAKLMKIFGLMDGENDPWYNRSTILTVGDDIEFLKDSWNSGGAITSIDYNGDCYTITRSSGIFTAGSIISIAISAIRQALVIVTQGGAEASIHAISGVLIPVQGGQNVVTATVIKSLSKKVVDVSGIYFRDFISLYDDRYTNVPGAKKRVFDMQTDPSRFYNHDKEGLDTKNVWWMQRGDDILLSLGTNANPLGQVMGEYRGKPNQYTDISADEAIDFRPEWNQMLIDEIVASYCVEVNKPIPTDVSSRLIQIEKMYESAQKNKIAALERKQGHKGS